MSNLININNIISSLNISDIKQTITLDKISAELSKAISTNKYGMLEVLANSDGLEFFLQIDENSFAVDIKNKFSIPLATGEKITIPVKINPSGVMVPTLPKQNQVSLQPQNEVVIETKEALINKPTLTPIKLQNFFEENIKDVPLDNKTRQQIIQIAKDIEVSIAKIGNMPEKSIDVSNLQKALTFFKL